MKSLENKTSELIRSLIEKCDEKSTELLIEAELDEAKVEDFKNKLLEELNKSESISGLTEYGFGEYNPNVLKVSPDHKKRHLEYNPALPKEYFIADSSISYSGIEPQIALCMSRGKDDDILRKIKSHRSLTTIEDLDSFEEKVFSMPNLCEVFIIQINTRGAFSENKHFKYKNRTDIKNKRANDLNSLNSLEGYLSFDEIDVPVFSFYDQSDSEDILVLDRNKFITYTQYKPDECANEEEAKFYIEISSMDDATIETIIHRSENTEATREEQIKNLKTQVIFKLSESYDIEFLPDFYGYKFSLNGMGL